MRLKVPVLLVLACLTGCNLISSDSDDYAPVPIKIQTDKAHYNLKDDESVEVTITNRSSRTLYYSTCLPKAVEMISGKKITQTIGLPVCYCLCPAELKPGEMMPVHISTISLQQRFVDDVPPEKSVSYRIRYSFHLDETFGDKPVAPKYSRSNKFTLTGE